MILSTVKNQSSWKRNFQILELMISILQQSICLGLAVSPTLVIILPPIQILLKMIKQNGRGVICRPATGEKGIKKKHYKECKSINKIRGGPRYD